MNFTEFFHTFGHDIEVRERRDKKELEEKIRGWLTENAQYLCQAYDLAEENAEELSGGSDEFVTLAVKTFVYEMVLGAINGTAWNQVISGGGTTISKYSYVPYQQLMKIVLENRVEFCSAGTVIASIERESPVFSEEGRLSESVCGKFWQSLMEYLPEYEGEDSVPEEVSGLLNALSFGYGIFQGDISEDEYEEILLRQLMRHWEIWSHAHPVPEKEEEPEEYEYETDMVKALILKNFPEIRDYFTAERLDEMDLCDIFGEVYPEKPEFVIRMWKFLLNRMEDRLQDPEQAEFLIFDIMEGVWNSSSSPAFILKELVEDDCFAEQVFGSAYTGYPQEDLIRACPMYGCEMLQQKLLDILSANPAFEGFDG